MLLDQANRVQRIFRPSCATGRMACGVWAELFFITSKPAGRAKSGNEGGIYAKVEETDIGKSSKRVSAAAGVEHDGR